jgi:hypothetical protein
MGLMQDPWVLTIIGGAVAGLIVAMLTPPLQRTRSEASKKRAISANQEVLGALRRMLGENSLPEGAAIVALCRSAARKHVVPLSLMASTSDLLDDLISELMDSPFLPAASKVERAAQLERLRAEGGEAHGIPIIVPKRSQKAPLLTGLLAFFLAALLMNQFRQSFTGTSGLLFALLVLVGTVAVTVVLAAMVFVLVSNLSKNPAKPPEITFAMDEKQGVAVVTSATDLDWSDLQAVSSTSDVSSQINNSAPLPVPGQLSPVSRPILAGDRLHFVAEQSTEGTIRVVHTPTNSILGTWNVRFDSSS